jgi:hypothetical protein
MGKGWEERTRGGKEKAKGRKEEKESERMKTEFLQTPECSRVDSQLVCP